jgi:diguanylate cyclase (GGDEF)-like protein
MRQQYGWLHTTYLLATGLAGWTSLVSFTWFVPSAFGPWVVSWELAACLMLALMARSLSFRVFEDVRIALDTAFYLAATFIYGTVAAGWLVAATLTVDRLGHRLRYRGQRHKADDPPFYVVAEMLQAGGLPVLVLFSLAYAMGVDDWRSGQNSAALHIQLPIFALMFLALHYFVAGGSNWFRGTKTSELLKGYFLKVLAAEFSLVPLALAMVMGYMHEGIVLFFLLAGTCIVFNAIFRRAVVTGDKLKERVQELSTLNEVGRIIAASLERRALLTNLSSATLRLVGHSSQFFIGVLSEDRTTGEFELFDEHGSSRRMTADPSDGLSGWVMKNRRALRLGDIHETYKDYSKSMQYFDARFRSWLGVPLITYDEVIGVMSVQSTHSYAYTEDHLRVLTTIADEAAVALENSRLYELATVDGLTHLYVRRYWDQRLLEEWKRSERYDNQFAVGLLDIDNLKQLNDTYGHHGGDVVLRAAAQVVRDNMRGADIAGRYGGEEFAFILPRTNVQEAHLVAERIREDVEQMEVELDGISVQVTASLGIAGYPEASARDALELVALADAALYEAKASGKNRVIVYDPTGNNQEVVAQADGE